ncbi:MAG: SMP-30/gluconolactonase/LRE family protein [Acidimicrobiales bacterium]
MRELVATPCTAQRYELGESCRWDDVRGELSWVDVYGGQFFRAHADGQDVEVIRRYDLGGHVSASAPRASRTDGWIIARDQSILTLGEEGSTHELAAPEAARPDVRLNDGAADPWGRFWIGSMAYDEGEGRASLYRFDEHSGVTTVLSSVTISNGLAWSADRSTMYYIDTATAAVSAFDLDEEGLLLGRRVVVQLDGEREGYPDGMCIDGNGDLWVALFNGHGLRQYSPVGELLTTVRVDTAQVTSCAIGGTDGTTLYITTGQERMSDEERRADPLAGRLFCVDVGVSAPPIFAFGGPALR